MRAPSDCPTALIYPPAVYAPTQEIAALAAVAARRGGRYYTHMRNEGDLLLEAIDEALDIGKTSGAPCTSFISRQPAGRIGPRWTWPSAAFGPRGAAGQQITADIYPYVNNGLGIAAFIHPRHFSAGRGALLRRLDDAKLRRQIRHEMEAEGGWENWYQHVGHDWGKVVIGRAAGKYSKLSGRSLAEIARAHSEDPWTTFFELVKLDAFALPQSMNEANKIKLMQQEFVAFCTDVGPAGGSRIASHPRGYGAFPRIFNRYVRDLGAISLERAVAQAAASAANNVLAWDRGRVAVGQAADLIVFDPAAFADQATFSEPAKLASGMDYVIVNGRLALDRGELTEHRGGRVLRGPGWNPQTAPHRVATETLKTTPPGRIDNPARFRSFDRVLQDVLREHRVPGAALAIAHQGRLSTGRASAMRTYRRESQRVPITCFASPASPSRLQRSPFCNWSNKTNSN